MSEIILATINAKWIHPSLALRLLKANLGDLEEQCEILEFALRQPLREKLEPILAARPRILALSVSIWNHTATLELLKALEEVWRNYEQPAARDSGDNPGLKPELQPLVVLGGPEVSWLPEDAEIFRHTDYVIRGEGEEIFSSLCHEVFSGKREPEKFINSGGTTVDPGKIASPYRLYTEEDLRRKLVYVEASRGCPFACEFCQGSVRSQGSVKPSRNEGGAGQPVREFPLEPFLADMAALIERGGRQFKFLDRTFNLNIDRAKRIMEFFLDWIKTPKNGDNPCVHFEMVPARFPSDLRVLIRRFPPGSLRLELGIQTFNPRTAAIIHRSGDAGEALEILEFLSRETSAIVHADLIAGLPGEDLASFGAGFDRLWQAMSKKGSPYGGEIQLGILKYLPGTPLARHNEAYGMKYSSAPPYEVIESSALGAAELAQIKNFARFWETIVNRNPFPQLIPHILPPGEPSFGRFMTLSNQLLENFGRNWGIDRKRLETYLQNFAAK